MIRKLMWGAEILVLDAALLADWSRTFNSRPPALRITSPAGTSGILLGLLNDGVEGLRKSDSAALFKDARSYEAAVAV